jgi:hypothetical protein
MSACGPLQEAGVGEARILCCAAVLDEAIDAVPDGRQHWPNV